MVSIASLLNPFPSSFEHCSQLPSPCPSKYASEPPPTPPLKKHKMSKDAAIFAKGKIQGELRYRPCEIQDEEIAEQHRLFKVYPMGKISEYCRHIPYNSEKKSFLERTGRESFEVFQYTFKVPGDEREYTVMWDYNIGLVRITPFFRCCGFSKTTPAKMLNSNPGLRDICHSITGGALAAQGYWMPFEAAKAVAATFCYDIRYALTPIFGIDFLSLCAEPGEDGYKIMIIDRDIIHQCTETANTFRALSRGASQMRSPQTPSSNSLSRWPSKSLRPKKAKTKDIESRYGTDMDTSDKYIDSPQTPLTSGWTALNTPRPTDRRQYDPPSPRIDLAQRVLKDKKICKNLSSEESQNEKRLMNDDGDYDQSTSSAQSANLPKPPKRRKKSTARSEKTRAAYMLLQLHMADARLGDEAHITKHRRASS